MAELAIKSTIQIAEIVLEVFRLPNGSFFLSQTQAAKFSQKRTRQHYAVFKVKAC